MSNAQDRFSVYLSPDDQRRLASAAQALTARSVVGLYHANGSVNRSALVSYLLQNYRKMLPNSAESAQNA